MAIKQKGTGVYQLQRFAGVPDWQMLCTLEAPNHFVARNDWENHQPVAYHYPFLGVMFNAVTGEEPRRTFYGNDYVRALTGDEVAQISAARDPWQQHRRNARAG